MTQNKKSPLLQHLSGLEKKCTADKITIKEIMETFGPEGHYLFLFFLVLPFSQPIPLFGLSTPLGLLMAIVSVFAFLRKPPYVPMFIGNKTLTTQTVLKIINGAERIFNKLNFIYPRLHFLFKNPFHALNTILVFVCAILIALPIPIPLANAIPAWVILFQMIAYLERDGLFIILSYIQAILCGIYFSGVVWGLVTATLHFLN